MSIAYYGFSGVLESSDKNATGRLAAALNAAANADCAEAHVAFSSLGGLVADGIFLYNLIRSLPLKVCMYNTGSVSSIAMVVFVAAAERYCSPHAMFMTHPTTLPIAENISAERLESALRAALADDFRTEGILRQHTRLPDEILQNRRFKDVHITPEEAVQWGLVQGVRDFALPQGQQIIQI